MHLLKKRLQKAKNSSINCQQVETFGDKNEPRKSVVLKTDNVNSNLNSPLHEIAVRMYQFVRELMLFGLILMAYSAFTNDPPKISQPPSAYPFFPKQSIVKDFYRGEILTAIEYARTSEFSFIMFYAPWDAESQIARKEFLIAANYMKDIVVFTAVNCWQPDSYCRNQYSKVYRWPVIIAYPSFGSGIQYNGPVRASNMIAFLYKLLNPVKRVINGINFSFEEAYLVAQLNALPKSMEYSVFYTVALKYLEADYAGRITFYVEPARNTTNKISLYLWNQVRILDIEPGNWKVSTILQWIIKNSESASTWIAPSGTKSYLLSDHFQSGPALILFTPKNPFTDQSDYYMMLQEIAYEYKNCDNWKLTFNMKNKRLSNFAEYDTLKKTCTAKVSPIKFKKITSVVAAASFLNFSTNKIKNFDNNINAGCEIATKKSDLFKSCECLDVTFDARNPHDPFVTYTTSMWRPEFDPKSMENLKKRNRKEKCRIFLSAEKLYPAVFVPAESSYESNVDLSDLCEFRSNTNEISNTNESLSFIAIDSLMYSVFAERLGIDLTLTANMSAVAILSEKLESHYIMEKTITSANLRQFIKDFEDGNLPRSRKSSVSVSTRYNPSYKSNWNQFNNSALVHVKELTSKNFLETLLQSNQAVLVMYYSKQCSHCNGISYIFLTVARKLSFIDNLQFARIDGDANILPWEYTMEEFPTVLFVPSNEKDETRVFPSNMAFTVPNLLAFILANVDEPMKLHVMYSLCMHTQMQLEKSACLVSLRAETMSLIGKMLREWRKVDNRRRQRVLHQLKHLKQLQFLFSHSPNDVGAVLLSLKNLKGRFLGESHLGFRSRNEL